MSRLRHEGNRPEHGLITLLETYSYELYCVWLLLGEGFSPAQFGSNGFTFDARPYIHNAIASRHWYSTASQALDDRDVCDPLVPVRLPGNYSVRGDWFLAIARGSRSPLLGERAIDLLSSRRANVARLLEGIGLPIRDFIVIDDDDEVGGKRYEDEVWTHLYRVKEYGSKIPITYGEVKSIGGTLPMPSAGQTDFEAYKGKEQFFWLWRSTLQGHDRESRVFLKMQSRLLYHWRKWLEEDEELTKKKWRSGFKTYDYLTQETAQDFEIYKKFQIECQLWIQCLKSSTLLESA